MKEYKVIQILIFVSTMMIFYNGISSELEVLIQDLKSSDFYIDLVVSVLFAGTMTLIFSRRMKRIKS